MVVVVTALCSMVSVVKSLFLLKSARDFAMKEIRASRGGGGRAFLCVLMCFFEKLFLLVFVLNLSFCMPHKLTKLKNLIKKGKTEKKQTKGRGENDENGGAL